MSSDTPVTSDASLPGHPEVAEPSKPDVASGAPDERGAGEVSSLINVPSGDQADSGIQPVSSESSEVHEVNRRPGARTRLSRSLKELLEQAASDVKRRVEAQSDHASAYQASLASIALLHYSAPDQVRKALWRDAGIKAGKRVLRLNPVLPTIKLFYADQDILKSKATQDAQAIRGAVEGAFKWKEGQNVPSHERLLEFFSTRVPRRDGKPGTVVGRDRGLQFYRLLQLVQDERGNKLTKKLQAEAERERELLDRTDPIAHIDLADEELAAIRAQTGGEVPARALAIISFEEGRLCLQRVGTSDKHAIAMAWKVAEKVTSPATTDTEHGPERPPMSKAEGAGGEGSTVPAAQSLEPDRFTEGEPQDTVPQPNTPANDVDHKSLRVGDRVSYKGVVGTLREVNGTTATVDFGQAGQKHVLTFNLTAVNAPEPANDGTDEGPSNPRRRHR